MDQGVTMETILSRNLDDVLAAMPAKATIGMSTVVGKWFRRADLLITRGETGVWVVKYVNGNSGETYKQYQDDSLKEAAARMLTFLSENGTEVKL